MADTDKKKVNSKGKGNSFELQIAKKLTKDLAPLKFMRTPGSGARVGGKNFEAYGSMFGAEAMKMFTGDVAVTNERDVGKSFLWSIETKFYKTPDNFSSLASGTANVFKWFEEAVLDAKKIDKKPMLIFKWNRTSIFAAVESIEVAQAGIPRLEFKLPREIAIYELDDLLAKPELWMIDRD